MPEKIHPLAFWAACLAAGQKHLVGQLSFQWASCSEIPRYRVVREQRPTRGELATLGSLTQVLAPPPQLSCLKPCLLEPQMVHLETEQ